MWTKYHVTMNMTGRFAAALPKTLEEIMLMLENRMPTNKPENAMPIDELAKKVESEVSEPVEMNPEGNGEEGAEDLPEEHQIPKFSYATFKKNEQGLYYEGRCVRGHIKECANIIKDYLGIKAFKSKVAARVYVEQDIIQLRRAGFTISKIDGTETRYIQVMTRQGPRSTIKYIEYLDKPTLEFDLLVLDDGNITLEHLTTIFDYGSVHGLGQERSQGWGRYNYSIQLMSAPPREMIEDDKAKKTKGEKKLKTQQDQPLITSNSGHGTIK